MNLQSVCTWCALCLASPFPAAAAAADKGTTAIEAATYEFTGTGQFCPLDSEGNATCIQGVAYTGTVTIKVLAPLPGGPGAFMTDRVASDPFGWIESDFVIHWQGRSFSPTVTPGEPTNFSPRHEALVRNNSFGVDGLDNMESHTSVDQARDYLSLASMIRRTTDTSWLDGVSFDLAVGLAPVVGGGGLNNRNQISFNNRSRALKGRDWRGYGGQFDLASLTPRTRVEIDIREDSINPRSRGVVKVAILGSVNFDATQVNRSRLEFGPDEAPPAHEGKVKDVNHDGFPDMLFHFRTPAIGIRCGSNVASLSGETFSGDDFVGWDPIRTAGCR